MKELVDAINNHINKDTDEDDTLDLIRNVLTLNNNADLLRSGKPFRVSHTRSGLGFDMSGYDSKKPGDCHEYNQYILNLFSDLDLARNMKLMYLDFYKGIGTFQYIYWNDDKLQEVSLAGYTTTRIIYTIIKICIIDNPARRRRESESLYTLGETK